MATGFALAPRTDRTTKDQETFTVSGYFWNRSSHVEAQFIARGVTKRYEYTSLDTRAPQPMTEVSLPADPQRVPAAELKLQGGVFLTPEWGNAKNVPFRYRLSIGEIEDDKQTIQLYLTPQSVLPNKEFLAFEYVYTRLP